MAEAEDGEGTAAVALVVDLMFASRVTGAARQVGARVVTVSRAEKLMEEVRRRRPRLVIVDLEARGTDVPALLARLKADPETAEIPVLGFGSHVNRDALLAGRQAGADRVLARSAFVARLPELLRGAGG